MLAVNNPPASPARSSLVHQLRYAIRHPDRIVPHLRRLLRDTRFHLAARGDHVAYYRSVMADEAARNVEAAIGSRSHKRWLALGKMQFDYLVEHGLRPDQWKEHTSGLQPQMCIWYAVFCLKKNYYGIDISPD